MSGPLLYYAVMAMLGLCWGFGIPMVKLSVSTGHDPLGVVAWQTIYMTGFLTLLLKLRRRRLPWARKHWRLYAMVAFLGTLIANTASYRAAGELPAGIMAIVIALVPMFSLPIALSLGLERWQWLRAAGLLLGAVAVVLLADPGTSLPEGTAVLFLFVALIAPFCYGLEGNYLALRGTGGLDSMEVLWGASLVAALVSVPVTLARGVFINPMLAWGPAEWAILASSFTHGIAYVGYVWLVGAAGAVFAAQVAYVVTGAGVVWSMLILGERYGLTVWLAFAVMLLGLLLVQPRRKAA